MAKLHVDQKSIADLLSEQKSNFLIPDYQRPYEWDEDKCQTLWDDIVEFATPNNNPDDFKTGEEYFLGSIVTFKNEDKQLEVIDGQQRLTTILLLLRAFYKKLEPALDSDSKGLKKQIEPCIWEVDELSREPTMENVRIDTQVATDNDRDEFLKILRTGDSSEVSRDRYSKNYQFFVDKVDEYAQSYPTAWLRLCVRLLKNCILLPIECESQDVALRIFSTLNDRGLPLADSDIFKAQLYKYYSNIGGEDRRKEFIESWQELTQLCKDIYPNADTSQNIVDEIFTLYTYIARSRLGIKDTTIIGLRKFYEQNKYEKLKNSQLVVDLIDLANFWKDLENKDTNNEYGVSESSLKYIHCLQRYPNQYWKYLVSVYYYNYRNDKDKLDDKQFYSFLKLITAYLFSNYILKPGITTIKQSVFNVLVAIANKQEVVFPKVQRVDLEREMLRIYDQSRFMIRPLLVWDMYQLEDQPLLDGTINLEIEHILPKKWQSANYNGWNKDDAEKYIEKIGNKIILEKKTNIQAGNNYFGEKKKRYYCNSPIKAVNNLAIEHPSDDWAKEDIEKREKQIIDRFIDFVSKERLLV
jgi:uncharacterized protein with ParB-like and HNH nuclease domain